MNKTAKAKLVVYLAVILSLSSFAFASISVNLNGGIYEVDPLSLHLTGGNVTGNVNFTNNDIQNVNNINVDGTARFGVDGNTFIYDTDDEIHHLNADLERWDELRANVFTNNLIIQTFYNNTGDYINISTIDGNDITFIIGNGTTANSERFDYNNIILPLIAGTNETPVLNKVYVAYSGTTPTWFVSTSDPSIQHAMASRILLGDTGTNPYAASLQEDGSNGIIKRTQRTFRKKGLLYESGLNHNVTATNLEIGSGQYINGLYDSTVDGGMELTNGFYIIHTDGSYHWYNAFDEILEYSNGATIGNNKYFNVIFGVTPYDGTGNIYAVIQNEPNTEYFSIASAWADSENTLQIYPNEEFLKIFFLPVARVIIKKGDNAQILPNGDYSEDYRGGVAGGVSSGGGLSESDPLSLHKDGSTPLTGDWNWGAYDLMGDGDLTVNSTLYVNTATKRVGFNSPNPESVVTIRNGTPGQSDWFSVYNQNDIEVVRMFVSSAGDGAQTIWRNDGTPNNATFLYAGGISAFNGEEADIRFGGTDTTGIGYKARLYQSLGKVILSLGGVIPNTLITEDGINYFKGTNAKIGLKTNTPNKDYNLEYDNSESDITANGLAGGIIGNGYLVENTNTGGFAYSNYDFRSQNADGRIAYQYAGATNKGDFHFITDDTGALTSQVIIRDAGNVELPHDNQKLSQGDNLNFNLSWDGTNQIYAISGGTHYFTGGNISVEGIIYHSEVDTSQDALEWFKDGTELINTDGTIKHGAFEECYIPMPIKDMDRPEIVLTPSIIKKEQQENEIEYLPYNETHVIYLINKTIYPYTKTYDGIDGECMYSKQNQALALLNQAQDIVKVGNKTMLDAEIISAETIYTESKTINPDFDYAEIFLNTDISKKDTHYAINTDIHGKNRLDMEERIVFLEGAMQQMITESCEQNKKYSWCPE